MKNPFDYTDKDLYKIMKEEGDRRFGSPCEHENTENGYCLDCFRKVIDKLPVHKPKNRNK